MTGYDAILYLENGHMFEGLGFGAEKTSGGEAVFNTGMTGYQEIFTDPSYSHQIVVMTGSHVGNTGVNAEDIESGRLYLSGVVLRDYCDVPSNHRSKQSLHEYLKAGQVPGLYDVDTREITRILRDEGAQRSIIFPKSAVKGSVAETGKKLLEKVPAMEGLDLVSVVSCKAPYEFKMGEETPSNAGTVVVYDFGVKWNILRSFKKRGFKVWVVPYNTPHEEVLNFKPNAVCLSNGPGDPAKVPGSVREIKALIGKVPILAICMGHQLLARALGGDTFKLKFGHHGVNHPVQDLTSGRILITSQNHGFCVKVENIDGVNISHLSLNDGTVEGFTSNELKFYSVQFHPEAAPGPSDSSCIFEHFIRGFIQ